MEPYFIIGILNIIFFYALWFYFYRTYFIDSHRHELFVLRDKLFNFALENEIPFDNPVFRNRWNEINLMIRFSHNSHIMFLSSLFLKRNLEADYIKFVNETEDNLKSLPNHQRDFFIENRKEQTNLFFSYLVKSSILLLIPATIILIIGVLLAYIFMINKRNNLRMKFNKTQESIFTNYALAAKITR